MIGAPEFLIETTFRDDPVPHPIGSDVLSDALHVFRVTGAALLHGEFTAPWILDAPPASALADTPHPGATRAILLHIVTEGPCWVEAEGIPRRMLREGSIVGFPLGDAHRMGAGDGSHPAPATSLFPPTPWIGPPILRQGGGGAMTRLVCVYLLCDKFLFNPILLNLPRLLAMSADDEAASRWIQTNVSYIAAEAAAGKPGSACLVSRLAELLFIEVLRRHVASLRGDGTGWLAALGDRHLSHALAALHARPEHAWTVSELALHSRLSRSALVQRFHRMLDIAPMRYLALWRLQLAAQALQSTDKGIAAIAAEIGYGSEEAFSRAFKRHADASPAVWRRARRNGAG